MGHDGWGDFDYNENTDELSSLADDTDLDNLMILKTTETYGILGHTWTCLSY